MVTGDWTKEEGVSRGGGEEGREGREEGRGGSEEGRGGSEEGREGVRKGDMYQSEKCGKNVVHLH